MITERNCWTVLAQRAQDETNLIQAELSQTLARLESLNASKSRLAKLYDDYRQQENSANHSLQGMREVMNQRQFMSQLLTLMQRVANDVVHAETTLSETRQRLMAAERERLKMQKLADQNASAILTQTEKRDQQKMDELGVMQFNLKSGS